MLKHVYLNKKQQKMEQEIRENTQIGDEITTIGGICGKVVSVKDDTIVIETGSDRVKIKFKKYAIQTNHTANEKVQAEREAAKAAKRIEKLKKQLKECRDYDVNIGHIALSRIAIDLDDGVKVNYEKVQTGKDGTVLPILAKI